MYCELVCGEEDLTEQDGNGAWLREYEILSGSANNIARLSETISQDPTIPAVWRIEVGDDLYPVGIPIEYCPKCGRWLGSV